ncbi:MAG: SRPBCC family protein, partial [Pseudomonadales bacterium]
MTDKQNICQVAFSALDAKALKSWYQQAFGLLDAGGTIFGGPSTTRVQGLPGVWEKCGWLIDSQHYFQLEFFQFWNPKTKPRRSDWQPSHIGYNMLGIAVIDFEQTLDRLQNLNSVPLTEPMGERGDRRVCVKDPEGNLVEVLEQDPLSTAAGLRVRPEIPATVRSMTLSVPNLQRAIKTWQDGLGLELIANPTLHSDEHSALWGMKDARLERAVLSSGNLLIELVQYLEPTPQGWPEGYRICDQGFMNVAVGLPDKAAFEHRYNHVVLQGLRPNGKPLEIGVFKVMYVNDADGFSVELLYARPQLWSFSGFNPVIPYVENEMWIKAPPEQVWPAITDHNGIGAWCLFKGRLITAGAPDENGLGAVRELRALGLKITEKVTSWEPNHRYSYTLTAGAPLKNHLGDVRLSKENGGTRVRWSIRFNPVIPGTGKLTAWLLRLIFRNALRRLK